GRGPTSASGPRPRSSRPPASTRSSSAPATSRAPTPPTSGSRSPTSSRRATSSQPRSMQPADVVLRFLESVGRADEAQFYLALFRGADKERFAALRVDATVVKVTADAAALALSFLAGLGLVPVVAIGLFAPADAAEQARALERRLIAAGVPAALAADADVAATAREGVVPIVALDGRIERLGAL